MYSELCERCRRKLESANKYSASEPKSRNKKKSKKYKKKMPVRTSTPVSYTDEDRSSSLSDPNSEFSYLLWKRDLTGENPPEEEYYSPPTETAVWWPFQLVYVNYIYVQQSTESAGSPPQVLGYGPGGYMYVPMSWHVPY